MWKGIDWTVHKHMKWTAALSRLTIFWRPFYTLCLHFRNKDGNGWICRHMHHVLGMVLICCRWWATLCQWSSRKNNFLIHKGSFTHDDCRQPPSIDEASPLLVWIEWMCWISNFMIVWFFSINAFPNLFMWNKGFIKNACLICQIW